MLGKDTAVESEHLGDIDYRVAGKTRSSGGYDDIAWGIRKLEVASHHSDDDSLNTAAVERVCLDDKYRPPEARFGAARFGEIGPPELAPLDVEGHGYQESLSRG
jgi:hypothetical protein